LKSWGFIRAYKHQKKPGYLTTVWIAKDKSGPLPPEVVWVRILRQIASFLNKRITLFLKALKIEPYQRDGKDNNMLYYICCNSAILSPFSHSIVTSLKCMSKTLDSLLRKIWSVKKQIAEESIANKLFSSLKPLNLEQIPKILRLLEEKLLIHVQQRKNNLSIKEQQILGMTKNG
jgi:hypothetical protein